jgi:hypothetical protein
MQNLPGQAAEAMGDGPDRFVVSQPGREPAIEIFEYAAFGLDRGVGDLG